MNHMTRTITLKIFTLATALLGYLLRYLLYATAIDQKGLLMGGHWATCCLTVLSLVFLAGLVLLARNPEKELSYEECFTPSAPRGMGALIGATGILIRSFRNLGMVDRLDKLSIIFGIAAGICLVIVGVCRIFGSKPYFLCHSVLSLFFAITMVGQYRHWSADPQLMNYGFYVAAFVCLMLCAYFLANFHVDTRNHRALWVTAMAAAYFCAVAIPESGDGFFLLACGIWAFTCPPQLNSKPRRQRPAMQMDEED